MHNTSNEEREKRLLPVPQYLHCSISHSTYGKKKKGQKEKSANQKREPEERWPALVTLTFTG